MTLGRLNGCRHKPFLGSARAKSAVIKFPETRHSPDAASCTTGGYSLQVLLSARRIGAIAATAVCIKMPNPAEPWPNWLSSNGSMPFAAFIDSPPWSQLRACLTS